MSAMSGEHARSRLDPANMFLRASKPECGIVAIDTVILFSIGCDADHELRLEYVSWKWVHGLTS